MFGLGWKIIPYTACGVVVSEFMHNSTSSVVQVTAIAVAALLIAVVMSEPVR